MRNQILHNAARVLEIIKGQCLSREEIETGLREAGLKLSADQLSNLLLDMMKLGWIERGSGFRVPGSGFRVQGSGLKEEADGYRIGMTMALYWRRALDAEKREMGIAYGRVKALAGDESLSDDVVTDAREGALKKGSGFRVPSPELKKED